MTVTKTIFKILNFIFIILILNLFNILYIKEINWSDFYKKINMGDDEYADLMCRHKVLNGQVLSIDFDNQRFHQLFKYEPRWLKICKIINDNFRQIEEKKNEIMFVRNLYI